MVIVFDATTSAQSEAQRESLSEHVDVVYSAGGAYFVFSSLEVSSASASVSHASHVTGNATGAGTADEFIEAEVRTLMLLKDPPLVYVATSDRVSGDVSFGSGAVMINSDQFIRNIVKTDEEVCSPFVLCTLRIFC